MKRSLKRDFHFFVPPAEFFATSAISRSPTPEAYPVKICSQVSLVIFRRILA